MTAVRLHVPGGPEALTVERIGIPGLRPGEALVRVHAAAITRDELEWPVDRLPATPSYELSGVVASVAHGMSVPAVGDAVYALTSFDRDGAAAEYVAVSAEFLAPKPQTLGHVESAAIPLAALSAWQGLFDHGRLESGERVMILGAAGGVGHLATQLARSREAHVLGTASGAGVESARAFGAHRVIDLTATRLDEIAVESVDLVFDTIGGAALAQSAAVLSEQGRVVSIAEEPPATLAEEVDASYFVVEPNREQLVELTRLVDAGVLRPAIDSVFALDDARAAFERSLAPRKCGKVVLHIVDD
jgi:NADPH:quinone reductase-like Zn-dependent oxidoreductase